jgi:nucleotide-binding universal stress UspA family protein
MTVGALQTACELAQFHGAKVFAVHILEVPYSIPLDAPLSGLRMGETILRRAEAIARESNVEIETSMVRARGIDEAILQLLNSTSYDLLVISAEQHKKNGRILGKISERLLRKAPCRVLIYSSMV